jgi:copper oxidase (laccase) domain-containing protein
VFTRGWKGTFKKIGEKTVIHMITNYGCKPEIIFCFICPSIRKCHFEVDEDVKIICEEIFGFTNRINEFIETGNIVNGIQKYNIDTVLINRILLEKIGLKSENIIDSNLCSVCNKDIIHSARVEGKNYVRALAFIML